MSSDFSETQVLRYENLVVIGSCRALLLHSCVQPEVTFPRDIGKLHVQKNQQYRAIINKIRLLLFDKLFFLTEQTSIKS